MRYDGRWMVQTAGGDVPVEVEADAGTGVVDFHLETAPGVRATDPPERGDVDLGLLEAEVRARPEGFEAGAKYLLERAYR